MHLPSHCLTLVRQIVQLIHRLLRAAVVGVHHCVQQLHANHQPAFVHLRGLLDCLGKHHLELVVVLHLLQNLQLLRTRLEPHQAPQRRAASFGGIHARHLRGLHFSPPLEQLQRALGVGQACRVLVGQLLDAAQQQMRVHQQGDVARRERARWQRGHLPRLSSGCFGGRRVHHLLHLHQNVARVVQTNCLKLAHGALGWQLLATDTVCLDPAVGHLRQGDEKVGHAQLEPHAQRLPVQLGQLLRECRRRQELHHRLVVLGPWKFGGAVLRDGGDLGLLPGLQERAFVGVGDAREALALHHVHHGARRRRQQTHLALGARAEEAARHGGARVAGDVVGAVLQQGQHGQREVGSMVLQQHRRHVVQAAAQVAGVALERIAEDVDALPHFQRHVLRHLQPALGVGVGAGKDGREHARRGQRRVEPHTQVVRVDVLGELGKHHSRHEALGTAERGEHLWGRGPAELRARLDALVHPRDAIHAVVPQHRRLVPAPVLGVHVAKLVLSLRQQVLLPSVREDLHGLVVGHLRLVERRLALLLGGQHPPGPLGAVPLHRSPRPPIRLRPLLGPEGRSGNRLPVPVHHQRLLLLLLPGLARQHEGLHERGEIAQSLVA
mmetsp:Transcript_21368/g.40795  ORF Transcript_21368/g.40795 Transcript_21368/m.40795 type:complete len:609 (-) Transcript_21368:535-2361(-)